MANCDSASARRRGDCSDMKLTVEQVEITGTVLMYVHVSKVSCCISQPPIL
jgi:hypothetical protein